MITEKDLNSLLVHKLDFRISEGKLHRIYHLISGSSEIKIPTFPVVPRHDGDLSRTVQKSIASALGLNIRRLQTSARCGISACCIYACLSAKVLGVGMERYRLDPTTYQHLPAVVESTVSAILALAGNRPAKWNADELGAIDAAREAYVQSVKGFRDVLPVLNRWEHFVN